MAQFSYKVREVWTDGLERLLCDFDDSFRSSSDATEMMYSVFLVKLFEVVLFVEVQFNTVQNEKGHQAQDVNVVVPPDQASYFGEIKSFNPLKGRLDQDGHQIIFLFVCVFFCSTS